MRKLWIGVAGALVISIAVSRDRQCDEHLRGAEEPDRGEGHE